MLAPANGITWKQFFLALKEKFLKDKLMDVAAGVTFFGVLALFPFLLFLVTLAGLVLQPPQVEQFIREIGNVAPEDASRIIAQQIRDIHKSQNVGLLTVGFIGAIWSASGGVVSLMDALNGLHHVEDRRPFWKTRGLAILTTLGGGAAILIAALVGVAAGPIAKAFGGPIAMVVLWLRLPVAGLLMALVWAVLYQILPDVRQRFRFLTPGSVVGVAVWLVASWGFSFYVLHFGEYNKTYGAIGGAIVMLMWMWISAMFLLVGAQINAVIEDLSAKRSGVETRPAEAAGHLVPASTQSTVTQRSVS
jgi:membrane protein